MKLKYVLFSGLLLSVGFTACTNEDFTETIGSVSTSEGIALDGVTLTVGNGADTKAVLGEDYTPTWVEGDLLGAARFHQITKYDKDKGEVTGIASTLDAFKANHTLELTAGAGTNDGTFTTQDSRGLEAGAHVLYYPQYDDVTPVGKNVLPVEIKSYTIDCAQPMKNVSDNMFAYSAVKFVPDQKAINDYTLKQVPVLYNLYFTPDFHYTQALAEPITIQYIVVEAWKGNTPVTTELGQVVAKRTVPSAADYNNDDLGKHIEYEAAADGLVDHLFYTVENSNNTDYQLVTNEVRTVKSFKFSALPWDDKADKVIIKVVTDKGTFTKAYDSSDKNAAGKSYLDMFNAQATAEGGVVSLNVVLDTTEEDEVIYTAEQMEDRLADIEAGETYHWIMGEPIEVNAPLDLAENATVYISRYPLTVSSLDATNGNLVVLNDLTVKGDALIGSNSKGFETVTSANIPQEDGTTRTANGDGNLSVDGKLTVAGGKNATAGKISIKLAKAGSLQVDASGIVVIKGIMDGTDYVTEIGDINNETGVLTLENISIAKDNKVDNTGTLTVNANVENNGTINQNGEFIMAADFTNKGTFNINDTMNGGGHTFTNAPGSILNIDYDLTTGNTGSQIVFVNEAQTTQIPRDAVINVEEGKTLSINATHKLTNNGIINVYGKVIEGSQALAQNVATALVNVFDNATLQLNTTSGIIDGYILPEKDANIVNGIIRVAAIVTADTDVTTEVNSAVKWYIISGNMTFGTATDNSFKVNSLTFTGNQTLTLEDGVTFTKTGGQVKFNGNLTIANSESNSPSGARFELSGGYNEVKAGSVVTLGKGITLAGKASDTKLTIENGAQLTKGQGAIEASTLTITDENNN